MKAEVAAALREIGAKMATEAVTRHTHDFVAVERGAPMPADAQTTYAQLLCAKALLEAS